MSFVRSGARGQEASSECESLDDDDVESDDDVVHSARPKTTIAIERRLRFMLKLKTIVYGFFEPLRSGVQLSYRQCTS